MSRRSLLLAAAAAGVVASVIVFRSTRPVDVLHAVELARPGRHFTPRFSIPTEYHPCRRIPLPADSIVPREVCGEGGDAPPHIVRIAAAGESLDPDSLQGSALAAVLWWDGKEATLDNAIERLELALRLDGDSVPLLVNLSAAYLVRAQETQNSRDLMAALNHADEALGLQPGNQDALFNKALASEALPLIDGATKAWEAYLAADSTSPWSAEAWEKLRRLREKPAEPVAPGVSSSAAEVDSFAAHHPQDARVLGWNTVLPAWGSAVLNDSVTRADSLLERAGRLANALERRRGGDASLGDAVRDIRAVQNDPAALRRLARAFQAYGDGQASFYTNSKVTRESFDRVLAIKPPSGVLPTYAYSERLARLVLDGKLDSVQPAIDSLLLDASLIRYPALTARLNWIVGKALFDAGSYRDARPRFESAARMYERIGESEFDGATRSMAGSSAHRQGDIRVAYGMLHQSLLALRPHPNSVRLHSLLFDLAMFASIDGMPSAAAIIQDEGILVSRRVGDTAVAAEGLLARAYVRFEAGETGLAEQDLDSAAVLIDSLDAATDGRKQHLTDVLQYSRAVFEAETDSTFSAARLDSAVAAIADRSAIWRLVVLMQRAELRLAAGDLAGANADLDSVTASARGMSDREDSFYLRASIMEQARSRFDQLVMLHVNARRPLDALQALERGRVSFGPAGDARAGASARPRGPQQGVAVDYALIGDTLLIWTLKGASVDMRQRIVNRDTLLLAIERAGLALETPGRAPLADPHLRYLYDALIRPVRERLGAADTPLVIVADGEIAAVPFAALMDAQHEGHYLIRDHPLRFAANLADAVRPPPPADTASLRALLVADPAFDRKHVRLPPLRGAGMEVDSLRTLYSGPTVLREAGATVEALWEKAPQAHVIHYAGHAVFDDTRPERSFLVLAGTGRLSADAVDEMQLGGVRMVVLSACRTLRARQGRSGGFAGLSGALLLAGAGGVVGSLWEANDSRTQPLMVEFHRQYGELRDPARALRQAQLSMLDSGVSNLASPAAWAGFRYMGR